MSDLEKSNHVLSESKKTVDDADSQQQPKVDTSKSVDEATDTSMQQEKHSKVKDEIDDSGDELTKVAAAEEEEEEERESNPEFLLLEDCNLEFGPAYVDRFLQRFNSFNEPKISANIQAELLVLLIYCIALESGLASKDSYEKCFSSEDEVGYSYSFHSENIRKLSKHYPTITTDSTETLYTLQMRQICANGEPASIQSRLTCIVSGDYLLVTLTPHPSIGIPGGSISLSINRYVLGVVGANKPVYHRLRKLNELSFLLRENVFVPVRNYQLSVLDNWNLPYPSLLGMPPELYMEIFKQLKSTNLSVLGKVCRHLRLQCIFDKRCCR